MYKLIRNIAITLGIVACCALPVRAGDLVVVTANENIDQLSLDDVARIFLGKVTRYPNGEEVVPLNLDPADPSYADFARLVLRKTPSQLKAYWAKRVFTGKGKPPRTVSSVQDLLDLVASDKRYLTYLDKNNVNHSVRLVLELKR